MIRYIFLFVLLVPVISVSAEHSLQLDLEQAYFVSPASNQSLNDSQTDAELSYEFTYKTNSEAFHIEAFNLNTLGENSDSYLAVPKLSYEQQIFKNFKYEIGRVISHFSELDKHWKLALWHNQFQVDYLDIKQQGHLGLGGTLFKGDYNLSMQVSPVYLPNQGANVRVEDGEIVSNSRWFYNPYKTVEISEGKESQLRFQIEEPEISDVINHWSYFLNVGNKQRASGRWFNLSYAYKPQSQLFLSLDPKVDISLASSLETDVKVIPHVAYHNVTSVEVGSKSENDNYWLSLTYDNPAYLNLNRDHYYRSRYKSLYASASAKRNLQFIGLARANLAMSYLNRWDELEQEGQGFSEEFDEFTLQRFKEAVSVNFDYRLEAFLRGELKYNLGYQYSVTEDGSILVSQLSYLQNGFAWSLGVEVLGLANNVEENQESFINSFKNNDRVFAGVSYVF